MLDVNVLAGSRGMHTKQIIIQATTRQTQFMYHAG